MYNTKDIEKNLAEFNYFIDESTLSNFIKNWKIDAIYEDEDKVEFFDNLAIAKLKKGISLKSQGYTNEQITYHVNKLLPEKLGIKPETKRTSKEGLSIENISSGNELKNVTIDVTHQTLQMLADTITEKIISQVKEQIKNFDFKSQMLDDNPLEEDNQKLSEKIDELTKDNKKLAKRIEELEKKKKLSPINLEYFTRLFK